MKILAIFFLVLTSVMIIYINIMQEVIKDIIPDFYCPTYAVTKLDAYIDKTNAVENGLMGCYCQANTSILLPWTYFTENFGDIIEQLQKKDDYKYYCVYWYLESNLKYFMNLIYLGSAVLINGLISRIFKNLDTYQRRRTKIEEASSIFMIIFLLEFSNMGLVVLVTGFD